LIPVLVRRANTRFAPTLVSDIGWISIITIYPKTYDRLLILYCTRTYFLGMRPYLIQCNPGSKSMNEFYSPVFWLHSFNQSHQISNNYWLDFAFISIFNPSLGRMPDSASNWIIEGSPGFPLLISTGGLLVSGLLSTNGVLPP